MRSRWILENTTKVHVVGKLGIGSDEAYELEGYENEVIDKIRPASCWSVEGVKVNTKKFLKLLSNGHMIT